MRNTHSRVSGKTIAMSTTLLLLLLLAPSFFDSFCEATSLRVRWGDQKKLHELENNDIFVPLEHSEDDYYQFHTTGIVTQVGEKRSGMGSAEDDAEDRGRLRIDVGGVEIDTEKAIDAMEVSRQRGTNDTKNASSMVKQEQSHATPCLDCAGGFKTVSEAQAGLGSVKPLSSKADTDREVSKGNLVRIDPEIKSGA